MINLKKDINFYKSYFRGLHDIVKWESKKDVLLGIVKVISLATFVCPIIFGVGLYIKESQLTKLSDLKARVIKVGDAPELLQKISGKDYVQYLIMRFKDGEKEEFLKAYQKSSSSAQRDLSSCPEAQKFIFETDLKNRVSQALNSTGSLEEILLKDYVQYLAIRFRDGEKEEFLKAYQKSSVSAQELLFSSFLKTQDPLKVLDYLPSNTKKISIALGEFESEGQETINQVKGFVEKIKQFPDLSILSVDISPFASHWAHEHKQDFSNKIDFMYKFATSSTGTPDWPQGLQQSERVRIMRERGKVMRNHFGLANALMIALFTQFKKAENLKKLTVKFRTHEITFEGKDQKNVLEVLLWG